MATRYVTRIVTMLVLACLALPGIAPPMTDAGLTANVVAAPGDNGKSDKPDKDKPDKGKDKPDKEKPDTGKPEKTPKPKEDKGNGNGNEQPGKQIDPPQSTTESYMVDLACSYDAAVDRSTCVASGTAPDGAPPIANLLIDTADVCAPIVGGSYLITPPTEGREIDGYGILGDTAQVILVFDGSVTVGSTATFWLSIDGSWIPASAPGLVCPPSADSVSTPEAVETPATGSIVATYYSCPAQPHDESEPDWFGTCHVMDSTLTPSLVNVGTKADVSDSGEATATGQTTWSSLEPGSYDLSLGDAAWCHAESDSVDGESNLIVEAGATTSVWLFFCSESSDGS